VVYTVESVLVFFHWSFYSNGLSSFISVHLSCFFILNMVLVRCLTMFLHFPCFNQDSLPCNKVGSPATL
jgi:hypothetical protein